uniref:PGG domain-containing protein n=1 Tax=Oryza glumipatula TaxID=40148 RepID=A0A0E0BQL3_9ORYZ
MIMSNYKARFAPGRQDLVTKWTGKDMKNWRDSTSKNLIIVSALVATHSLPYSTYQLSTVGDNGKANLTRNVTYNAYIVLDTVAVLASVLATLLLVYGRTSESQRSWEYLINAFLAALAAVETKRSFTRLVFYMVYYGTYSLILLLVTLGGPASSLPVLVKFVINIPRRSRLVISRHYPMTGSFVVNAIIFSVINYIAIIVPLVIYSYYTGPDA